MKKQIVRISIVQSSKIVVLLYSLLGLLYTIIGAIMLVAARAPAMRIMGIVYLFGPIWMGILGFVFFAIAAAIYNAAAGMVGGFEVEVQDVPPSL